MASVSERSRFFVPLDVVSIPQSFTSIPMTSIGISDSKILNIEKTSCNKNLQTFLPILVFGAVVPIWSMVTKLKSSSGIP